MIIEAFNEFLRRDLPMNDPVREQGRRVIRELVGQNIRIGRLQRDLDVPVAITLDLTSEVDHRAINGPAGMVESYIELNVWAKDTDNSFGSHKAALVSDALRKMLVQYHGPMTPLQDCHTILRDRGPRDISMRPADASGNWKFRSLTTFMIGAPVVSPLGAN